MRQPWPTPGREAWSRGDGNGESLTFGVEASGFRV